MKIGQLFNGQEVVDVKRVNKLNLVQFMKQVDEYQSQGYKIDINSCRQVGLVLQADVFKVGEQVSETPKPVEEVLVETKVEDSTVETEGEAYDSTEAKPKTTRTKKA